MGAMSANSTCPFCNSLLPGPPTPANCPRCGEKLGEGAAPQAAQRPVEVKRTSIGKVVAVGLIVTVLAGIAIVVWNNRTKSNRTGPGPDAPHAVIRPVDLPGIGYLPESCEMVMAIQMPLLMERLGPEAQADPAQAIEDLGLPDAVVETIDQTSGVGLRNVDQLVVGVSFKKGSLPPQLVVVVHTRQPYDFPALVRKAKATTLKKDGRTLHVVKSSSIPNVYWWSPNDRVLIGTIAARDFDEVPQEPKTGIDHLAPNVATLIRERVADDSCAWLAASSDKWNTHLAPYILLPISPLQGRKDLFAPAERLRNITIAIPHIADRNLDVQIDVKTAGAGEQLRTVFATRFEGEPIVVSGEGERCRLQTRFEPARIGSILGRLIQEK